MVDIPHCKSKEGLNSIDDLLVIVRRKRKEDKGDKSYEGKKGY